jgi:hypothetical protein
MILEMVLATPLQELTQTSVMIQEFQLLCHLYSRCLYCSREDGMTRESHAFVSDEDLNL